MIHQREGKETGYCKQRENKRKKACSTLTGHFDLMHGLMTTLTNITVPCHKN